MSNLIETVKEMYAAFGRGDAPAIMAHLADDVSWESEGHAELKFTGVRYGKAGAMAFFAGIAEEHGDPSLKMVDFVASGDSVAAFGRYQATVKGQRVDAPVAHLFQFENGKVARYVNLTNTAAFLEASRQRVATA